MKILIIYHSKGGTTRKMAKEIERGADERAKKECYGLGRRVAVLAEKLSAAGHRIKLA